MNPFATLGLRPVINAAGKMTALGGSAQSNDVAMAQADAAQWHVDLQELRDEAGRRIAAFTGAEAASVTTGAAAGIAISVAACITGTNPKHIAALPDSDGLANGILLQSGHQVNFGAPVTQMIRLGGGRTILLGTMGEVTAESMHAALQKRSHLAALLYVQSHHSSQQHMLSLADCVAACGQVQLPVIVDAAAEEDPRLFIAAGADLVTYSGGKAFGGPTSGFIAGRADLVAACELQQRGIARAMKVGKEQILGLLAALNQYQSRSATTDQQAERARLLNLQQRLASWPQLQLALHQDEAGRAIERLSLRVQAPLVLKDLVRYLAEGSPSIRTRNHHLNEGFVLIDPREITDTQAMIIAERIQRYVEQLP